MAARIGQLYGLESKQAPTPRRYPGHIVVCCLLMGDVSWVWTGDGVVFEV